MNHILKRIEGSDLENSKSYNIYNLPVMPELVEIVSSFIKKQNGKEKAFALRVNEDMIKAIEKWAADEFRSTNGQIEWMLNETLKKAGRQPKKK